MQSLNSKLKALTKILAIFTIASCSNYAISQGVVKRATTTKQQITTKPPSPKPNKKATTQKKNVSIDYGKLAEQAYYDKKYVDAIKYGELGAKQNNAQAMTILGWCYQFGHGVLIDKEKAVSYFQTASEQNYPYAQYSLGVCYMSGLGITPDDATARYWYAKVIENPDASSVFVDGAKDYYKICNSGVSYSADRNVHEDNNNCYGELADRAYGNKNYADAIKYGELGAKQNNAQAMTILGYCYLRGDGVSRDCEKAVSYFLEAAKQNNAQAMTILGWCYQLGTGISEDKEKAISYYLKAAEQNFPEAQAKLGDCYYYGWGVAKNYATARYWYAKVIENPNAKSDWLMISNCKESYQECNNGVPYKANHN